MFMLLCIFYKILSMSKIKDDQEYLGEMIHEWKLEHKNAYVITGMQQGGAGIDNRVGRVAQVRLESGDFGSDNVLLRHVDDSLTQHTNQSFWLIPAKFKEYLDECFVDAYLDDSDKFEYTLGKIGGATGFIIPSPIKDGESTPMRDIKGAIYNKISDIISED